MSVSFTSLFEIKSKGEGNAIGIIFDPEKEQVWEETVSEINQLYL